MAIDLGATPGVVRRIQRGLPSAVAESLDIVKDRLRREPRFVRPDKREIWSRSFPDLPNHRHTDLPHAWRVAWTIQNLGGTGDERVTIVFLGTHKEYDRTYGFRTS